MSSKPLLLVVACALIDQDNRILVTRRPKNKPMAGMWEFPGGKIEPGESPERALVRELDEELGIKILIDCLSPFSFASHDYKQFNLLMPLYICRKWEGIMQAKENQALKWVKPMALPQIEMLPADIPLVENLINIL